MSTVRRGLGLVFVAALAMASSTCGSPMSASDDARTVTVVLASQQERSAVPPPYVTVVDSVHLVVTSPSGSTLVTRGQRLQRHQTSVSFPVDLQGDAATFRAQVLSSNRTVVYEGTTTVNLGPNDFTVVVPMPAQRPVLLATPDTARASFDSAVTRGSLAIHNRGSGSLVWSVVPDAAFTQCGRACVVTPSGGTIASGTSDTMRITIPSAPPFSSRVFSFVLRSSEGDVSVQWHLPPLPVAAVAVSSTDVLLQVGRTEQLTTTVQVNGTASKAVVWSTSNANVAGVSTTGVAVGRSPGLATITAISAVDSTKKATALVRVFDPQQPLIDPVLKVPFSWFVTDPVTAVVIGREDNVPGIHSVTLRAAASGGPNFQNPMTSRVEFWYQTSTAAPWRLVSQSSSATLSQTPTVRTWAFTTTWNPDPTNTPFPTPSTTRLILIGIGISSAGAVYPTPLNTNITITVP
jgi:hypothetical protein